MIYKSLITALLVTACINCFAVERLAGKYMFRDSMEFVYQEPTIASISKYSGALFLAHGCQHSATDWWPKSESCLNCIGLPVETTIVAEALKRKYLVFALSSSNRDYKCWRNEDIEHATKLISHMYKEYLSSDFTIPLYLLGASSGGSFVGVLGSSQLTKPLVSATCIQIMSLRTYDHLPPSLFVLMSRDVHTKRSVEKALIQLSESTNNNQHKMMAIKEQPITSTYFYDHGKVLSKEDSIFLHKQFVHSNIIHPSSFLLLMDPRKAQSTWREVVSKALPHIVPSKDTLIADSSGMSELMNMAWAGHEITDAYLKETFDWFELHKDIQSA